MTDLIRIGTRGSQLALAQAGWTQTALQQAHAGLRCELVVIKTSGDRILDRSLRAIGGKGLFVKEIEEALLRGEIDCAVHSMKDLPADLAAGLVVAAVPAREDPRDLLITRGGGGLNALPRGARVGTSSLRRTAFVRHVRPDVSIVEIRGNVDTRLRKLDAGEVDAVLLAAAGLNRLSVKREHAEAFDPDDFLPAIGQGALALECRAGEVEEILAPLDNPASRVATTAERAFLARIGGSCQTPLAAYATVDRDRIEMRAAAASPDGTRLVRDRASGMAANAETIGSNLADELLRKGAAEILEALRENEPSPPRAPG